MQRCVLNLLLLFILQALPAHAVSASFTQLYGLAGNCDATLVESTSGQLFGTTLNGPSGAGVIFRATSVHVVLGSGFTNLHTFVASDGGDSHGGLAMAPSGMLYGTTARLAQSNNIFQGGMGSIYGISQTGAFNVLYRFGTSTNDLGQPLDGASPRAVPVVAPGDTLYGTAFQGGSSGYDNNGLGYGVIFSIQTNGNSFTVLHSFSGSDGANPTTLAMGKDGSLYGA